MAPAKIVNKHGNVESTVELGNDHCDYDHRGEFITIHPTIEGFMPLRGRGMREFRKQCLRLQCERKAIPTSLVEGFSLRKLLRYCVRDIYNKKCVSSLRRTGERSGAEEEETKRKINKLTNRVIADIEEGMFDIRNVTRY